MFSEVRGLNIEVTWASLQDELSSRKQQRVFAHLG